MQTNLQTANKNGKHEQFRMKLFAMHLIADPQKYFKNWGNFEK